MPSKGARSKRLENINFFIMTDKKSQPDPAQWIKKLPKGSAVILRDYDHPKRESWANYVTHLCKASHIPVFIAADIMLACRLHADGVHLPEHMLPKVHKVRHLCQKKIITAAAHTPPALKRAESLEVDGALVSPALATDSHPDERAKGLIQAGLMAKQVRIAVYALGGMDFHHYAAAKNHGLQGIAGISLAKQAKPCLFGNREHKK